MPYVYIYTQSAPAVLPVLVLLRVVHFSLITRRTVGVSIARRNVNLIG